ncbi:SPASM domain-containing protein, partial [Bacteroides fragilis]
PDYFKKYVSFNSVLHDRNSTRSIQEFIYKEFGKVSQVSELNNFGICESKQEEFDKLFHKIIDDISISDTDFTEHFPDMVGLFRFVGRMSGNYFVSHNYLLKKSPNKSCPTGTCMPFGKKMFITVNGKILPCERIDQKYTLGYITDKGIELDLAKVARIYSDYYHKIKPSCERCYLKAFCSQCMFYMENLDGQVKCPSFSNEESIRKYINYYSNILQNHPELYKKVSTEILLQL